MDQKKLVYTGSAVSGIHWESWNVSLIDKGGLLY